MIKKIQNYFAEQNQALIFIFAGCLLFYFIFSPGFNILYYAGDDYRYALGGAHKACHTDDGFYFMLALGRPLQAYLDCISYRFAYTLEHMRIIRIVAVLIMGCSAGLLADWFKSLGMKSIIAFLSAACLLVVPHLYSDTILMGALSLPVPILLTIISYRLVEASFFSKQHNQQQINIKVSSLLFLSILCLIAACLSYPAMAFFFCTLVLAKILLSAPAQWAETKKIAGWSIGVFFVGCSLFFGWASINMSYMHSYHGVIIPPQYHLSHPNLSVSELLKRITNLGNIFGEIWKVFPYISSKITSSILMFLILIAGFISLMQLLSNNTSFQSKSKGRLIFEKISLTIFVVVLCNAFPLIIPVQDFGGRLHVGTIVAALVLGIWAITRIGSLFQENVRTGFISIAVLSLLFFEGSQANKLLMTSALQHGVYLNTVVQKLEEAGLSEKVTRVHFLLPKDEVPYTRFFLINGALKQIDAYKNYSAKWCAASRDNVKNEKAFESEINHCIDTLPKDTIAVTYSFYGEKINNAKNTLFLDVQFNKVNLGKLVS